jgi:hypothetical protein
MDVRMKKVREQAARAWFIYPGYQRTGPNPVTLVIIVIPGGAYGCVSIERNVLGVCVSICCVRRARGDCSECSYGGQSTDSFRLTLAFVTTMVTMTE